MKTIKIIVKPNSRENKIEYDPTKKVYKVFVKAPAEKNKANKEVIKILNKKFKTKTEIIKGQKSKQKIIKIQ